VTKNCVSLKGDKFTLEKGMKIVVRKIHKNKGYAECSLNGMNGMFNIGCLRI